MSDKIKLADGSEWDNNTSPISICNDGYEYLILRRKKPEENKHEGISTPIKTHYADQLVPTYEAFEALERRVQQLENRCDIYRDSLLRIEKWRKAE